LNAGSRQSDSFHIESHGAILRRPLAIDLPERKLDAIVVPTIRPRSLQAAAALANDMACPLVVLCSTPEQADEALRECRRTVSDLLVTWVPQSADETLLPFLTSVHPEIDVEPSCHIDIARKRNVGLLLARLCNWQTVMYLDDDIRGLTADAVSVAAALTTHSRAVGFEITDYPDNSVVCHANRLAGGKQDVFPGGSALLIDASQCDSLFPPVYNEDWLFLFNAVQAGSVATAGSLSQLPYQPFAHSRRAGSEEFGDVIAEGLYWLIHLGVGVSGATYEYWQEALARRSLFIKDVAARLLNLDGGGPDASCALMSLAAAGKRLDGISELACVSFIRAWQEDLTRWRHRLDELPRVGSPAEAVRFLDLPSQDRCVPQ
jgi:hypothetical protein